MSEFVSSYYNENVSMSSMKSVSEPTTSVLTVMDLIHSLQKETEHLRGRVNELQVSLNELGNDYLKLKAFVGN